MATERLHFITTWHVNATAQEVYQIIKDSSSLATWWPSVYLDVKVLDEGQSGGIGKKVALWTKGFLPYTLKWDFEVTEVVPLKKIALKAQGDLIGQGVWTFKTDRDQCMIQFDWDVHFKKSFLSAFSFMLRPLFAFNHRWAMDQGLISLKLEILRRKGVPEVSAPPQPTFPHQKSLQLA